MNHAICSSLAKRAEAHETLERAASLMAEAKRLAGDGDEAARLSGLAEDFGRLAEKVGAPSGSRDWGAMWSAKAEGHRLVAAANRAYERSSLAEGDIRSARHHREQASRYEDLEARCLASAERSS